MKVLYYSKTYSFLQKEIANKVRIYNNTNVIKIDAKNGSVHSEKLDFSGYSYVINTTYTNPNLGLYLNKFKLKYELIGMVGIKIHLKNL